MNPELTDLLSAANPAPIERVRALPVGDALDDLAGGVRVAAPAPAPAPARRRYPIPRVAFAVAALCAAMLVFLAFGNGPGGPRQSGTAWAAEQVRFAEASPLVLLAGSRVIYADEESAEEGEMRFAADAQLNWRGGQLADWTKDRADGASVSTTAPVLGTTAHVYEYAGGSPGHQDITALFRYDGRILEFRAEAADVPAFARLLASLKRVDTDAWLSAMPASAIPTADRATTVEAMLRGIPLPDGYDPSALKTGSLVKDRYQLGAAVVGSVACQWFGQWSDGLANGNDAAVHKAVAALATAKDWPIVREMNKSGDYGRALEDYASRMDTPRDVGDWSGGLGCADLSG